jgi:hypothetical protein
VCTLKSRVRVEIFKDETDLIFMQIVTQNDEIEVSFTHITIPSLHIDHTLLLGLGLGLGLGCTLKGRVRVEIFKDETDLIFMQIVTQNDEIEVSFTHITIPSLHIDHTLLLGLGVGVGAG